MFITSGDYDNAFEYFDKATRAKDEVLRSKAYYNAGNALFNLGKLKDASLLTKISGIESGRQRRGNLIMNLHCENEGRKRKKGFAKKDHGDGKETGKR